MRVLSGFRSCAIAVLLIVCGCANATVQVVQRVAVDRPLDRVFIVVHEGGIPSCYAHTLSAAVMERLGPHVGARKSRVLTGVEFDTTFLEREIDAFQANAVLELKPMGSSANKYGATVGAIYGATLHDRPSKRPIWSAKVQSWVDSGLWVDTAMNMAAEELVAALASDRMIPPERYPRPPLLGSTPAAHRRQ